MKREIVRWGLIIVDSITYLKNRKELNTNDFNEFLKEVNTPSKMGAITLWRFDYTSDKGEYWQKPKETFDRRNSKGKFMGDCEDISSLILACALSNGIEGKLLTTWNDESGHATCFLPQSQETICSFNRIKHYTNKIEDIVTYWYKDWKAYALYELRNNFSEFVRVDYMKRESLSPNNIKGNMKNYIRKMMIIDSKFENLIF